LNDHKIWIGAHTSAAGGVYNALVEGRDIGASTIQLFTANQKRWDAKPYTAELIKKWHEVKLETELKHIMSHDSYLINLACPNDENLFKSRKAFAEELDRCLSLEIDYLNFHPGASLDSDRQQCLERIVESLLLLEPLFKDAKKPTRLLLETTAGQGSTLGKTFEEIAFVVHSVEKVIPVGVCIDTCHIFVAGYDIRTPEAFDATLKEFDRVIGLKHLYGFHLNDSVKGLGSKVDRHADIGKGLIGIEAFKFLMNDKRTKYLPKYLETPGGPELWKQEIALLKGMIHEN